MSQTASSANSPAPKAQRAVSVLLWLLRFVWKALRWVAGWVARSPVAQLIVFSVCLVVAIALNQMLLPWIVFFVGVLFAMHQFDRRKSVGAQATPHAHAVAHSTPGVAGSPVAVGHAASQPQMAPSSATPQQSTEAGLVPVQPARDLPEVLTDIDALIGLTAFKEQIRADITSIEVQRIKEQEDPTYQAKARKRHAIYSGPPGSGKSMVAKLHAEVYAAMGLSTGRYVNISVADLIRENIGAATANILAVLDGCPGGVVFLDEFSAVVGKAGSGADMGMEVVKPLVHRMENDPNCPTVIIADYEEAIQRVLDMDAGLASRFRRIFRFVTYTPSEMVRIIELKARADRHHFTPDAITTLKKRVGELHERYSGHPRFASGREAETLYDYMSEAQEQAFQLRRSLDHTYPLGQLVVDDVELAVERLRPMLDDRYPLKGRVRETRSTQASQPRSMAIIEAELDALIGLESVKRQVLIEMKVAEAEAAKKQANPDYRGAELKRHTLFPGPPGAGKTTIATKMSEFLTALGLSNGSLGVTTGGKLVGSVIGEGTKNTHEFLDEHLGGVVLIDEAGGVLNRAGQGADLGMEVVEAILDRAENDPHCPTIFLADYRGRLNEVMGKNAGLRSRFRTTIPFRGYSAEEMTEIALLKAHQDGHTLSEDAVSRLKEAMSYLHQNFSEHPAWASGRIADTVYLMVKRAQAVRLGTQADFRLEREDVQEGMRMYAESDPFPDAQVTTFG